MFARGPETFIPIVAIIGGVAITLSLIGLVRAIFVRRASTARAIPDPEMSNQFRQLQQSVDSIALEVDSKEPHEIKTYAKTFWQRYTEIHDYNKYIKIIEDGEDRMRKIEHQRKMLRKKMSQYRVPLQQLKINYSVSTTNKKVYTEEEDRFLLVLLDRFGVDSEGIYEKIRDEIRESPLFRFDWFFLSRTPTEIGRRCNTLLTTIVKEFEDSNPSSKPANGVNGKSKREPDDDENDEDSILGMAPAKKKSKANGNGVKVGIHLSQLAEQAY